MSASNRVRRGGLTGPLMMIAVGTIFLVGKFLPEMDFQRLWPVLLIVAGVAALVHRTRQ